MTAYEPFKGLQVAGLDRLKGSNAGVQGHG